MVKRLSLPYTHMLKLLVLQDRFCPLMKKVTDVIREMGPTFSNTEEDFSIPKVKQPVVGEKSSVYSVHESGLTDLHQSRGIFQLSVSSSFHTSSTLLGTNRERLLLRDENDRAYAESLRIDMESDS